MPRAAKAACAELDVTGRQPQSIVSGFNIYSPALVSDADGNPILIFGGWLKQEQLPNDAIYRCQLTRAQNGFGPCGEVMKIADAKQLSSYAEHLNDPSVSCDASTGECRFAATVCVAGCGSNPKAQRLSQIWIGRSQGLDGLFTKMVPFLVDGAAEPSLGVLPTDPKSPVIYFTRRRAGELNTIFAQKVDWQTLVPDGDPVPVLIDKGNYVVSSVAYLGVKGCHILMWDRLEPLAERPHLGALQGIMLAYSLAGDGGSWSAPRALQLPAGAPCAALTPALAEQPDGHIALFIGDVRASDDGVCRLASWSKQIVAYELVLR